MAKYAWVSEPLLCPSCGEPIADMVWFAWGGLITTDMGRGPTYRIGDHLLWLVGSDGIAKPYHYWSPREGIRENVNLGDPAVLNVDVFEQQGLPSACAGCSTAIHRSCVSIRRGVITGVSVVAPGVVDDDLHAVGLNDQGEEVVRFTDMEMLRKFD